MPVSIEEFPEREFWSRQIHFTASDCETLYWLVVESGLPLDKKERLSNKLRGYFVSTERQRKSEMLMKKRSKEMKERIRRFSK